MQSRFLMTLTAAMLIWPLTAQSAPRDRSTVEGAISVLDEISGIPEKSIPPALLRDAHAVLIAPDLIKGGFVFAGRHGHGVLLIRGKDGTWSNPVFVKLTGASLGLQVGVQATDLLLVFRDRRSLDRLLRGAGKLTLGADASVAAGPLGRQASADTDAQMRAEILSYSRARGIFAGIAVEGDSLRIDREANEHFYNQRGNEVSEIVGVKVLAPASAATLRTMLMNWPERTSKLPVRIEPPVLPKP